MWPSVIDDLMEAGVALLPGDSLAVEAFIETVIDARRMTEELRRRPEAQDVLVAAHRLAVESARAYAGILLLPAAALERLLEGSRQ